MNKKLNNNFSLKKLLLTALVSGPLATLPAPLWALPDVSAGNLTTSAGVTTQVVGSTLNVTSPDKAVLTWQGFGSTNGTVNNNIISTDIINYFLPTASSSVLNTVTGGVPSTIAGQILSNGNVYILNPAGIVISPTAQINVGGFYASTVSEPSGFFGITGTLSYAGNSNNNVTVQGTGLVSGLSAATIQAVGPGNNIYLAGQAVNVDGGKFFGNLFVRASGVGTNSTFGATGPVSVNLVGVPLVGGGLDVRTNGGNAVLSGGGTGYTLTIAPSVSATTGAVSINTTGTSGNGSITQGLAAFTANTTGSVVTLNAGTVTPNDITLPYVDLVTVGATGKNVTIFDTANGLAINATTATGDLTLKSAAGITQAAGTNTVAGNIALLGTGSNTTSFTASGNITFSALNTTSTVTVTSSGNIALPGANAYTTAPTVTLVGGGGTGATATAALTSGAITGFTVVTPGTGYTSAPTVILSGGGGNAQVGTAVIGTGGAANTVASITPSNSMSGSLSATMAVTSSTGSITAGVITSASTLNLTASQGSITAATITANTATLSAAGNITVTSSLRNAGGSTMALTSSTGSISLGGVSSSSTLNLTATAGSITTGFIQSNTLNLTAANGAAAIGTGFTSVPTATVTGGGGSGGTLTPTVVNGVITAFTVATPGTGYTSAPTVSITDGGVTYTLTSAGTFSAGGLTGAATPIQSSNFGNAVAVSAGTITTGTISSSSTLTLSAPSATGTITAGTITKTNTFNTTLTSGGSITLPGITANAGGAATNVFVNSTAGSISQTAGTSILSTGNVTLNAAADINLPNVTNDFTTLVLLGGASATSAGANVVDANNIVLGTATNTLAPTTITTTTNGTISLGNAAVDTLNFGSTLTLRASGTGTIGTNANTVTVLGNVSLTTTNTAATLGQTIFGNAANYKFGQIQASLGTGALNVSESTTLNLGVISAGSIDARSLSGDVVNTGALTVTGPAIFSANSIFSPGSVSLTNTSNALSGPIFIGNAANFTLVNTVPTTVTAGTPLVNGKAGGGVTDITVTGAGNALTLKTDIGGAQTGGDFATISFTAPGAVTITDPNTVTLQNISNTGSGAVSVTAGGPIVLGSGIVLGSTGLTTLTSTGATAAITDSAPNIRINGNVAMVSDNSIAITNAGHSLGAVSLTTTGANGASGSANITYTEGGSANLNAVLINTSGSTTVPAGSLTVVSTGGDVIQTNVAAPVIQGRINVPTTGTGTNTVSFSSSNGIVELLNPAGTNAITPVIAVSAVGNSTIAQGANISLGNVAVTGGTLSVDASALALATISQATGSTIKAFGNSTFKTRGGVIILANSGNNFGGLTLTSNVTAAAGADVAITEAGTLNFVSVNTGTAGKLTAISENEAIIQSGTLPIVVGGATSLRAADAGVTLNTSTTNTFGGQTNNNILVTTVGNVNIQDSAGTTILNGASTIGGSLILKNSSIGGTIKDSPGTLTVSGNVLFDTSTAGAMTGTVTIGSSTAALGAIQFRSGTVTIVENDTLNLNAGSVASGAVSLTSSNNIVTSGSGGGTFQNKLDLNASGAITITNPIFVNGASSTGPGLTFRALGAVDLSSLSLAGNLNSIAPTNLGASSYKAPSP